MSKWYGMIGFSETEETEPGLWEPVITEKPYYGDVISNRWKRQPSGGVNDNINITNSISIIADPYAVDHCSKMAYIEYLGTVWKITDVDVQFPRLVLSIGGEWNGERPQIDSAE